MVLRRPTVERRAPAARPRAPWGRRAVSAALWGVVVTGVLAYVVTLAVPLWFQLHGERLLVVTSGSMAPQFVEGDVVVLRAVRDPSELKPRLVVAFQPVGSATLVTHRIVSLHNLPAMREVGDGSGRTETVVDDAGRPVMQPYIRTQGDANAEPDPNATPVERVRGVVLRTHHGWGRVLLWAGSAQGRAVMLVPPLVALATLELVSLRDARRRTRAAPTSHGPGDVDVLVG